MTFCLGHGDVSAYASRQVGRGSRQSLRTSAAHELLIAPRDIEEEAGHEPTISHLLSLSARRRSRPKPFWIDLPGVIGRTALSGEYRAN